VIGLLWFVLAILVSPFRSKARLEAEIATLRQQLIVLQRKSRGRVRLCGVAHFLLASTCALYECALSDSGFGRQNAVSDIHFGSHRYVEQYSLIAQSRRRIHHHHRSGH
jgi:hypothetical protein